MKCFIQSSSEYNKKDQKATNHKGPRSGPFLGPKYLSKMLHYIGGNPVRNTINFLVDVPNDYSEAAPSSNLEIS